MCVEVLHVWFEWEDAGIGRTSDNLLARKRVLGKFKRNLRLQPTDFYHTFALKFFAGVKNWRIYIVLLIASFAVLQYGGVADASQVMPSPSEKTFAFTPVSNAAQSPGEQTPNIQLPGINWVQSSMDMKDFHKYVDNPFVENSRIERQILSYMFFSRTLQPVENLIWLRRLII